MALLRDIFIGFITGLASGWLVYLFTKYREKKYQVYYFWRSYLFDVLKHCEMYIPVNLLEQLSIIGGKESDFGEAIYAILDDTHPFDTEDRELTDREIKLANNVIKALGELDKWQKQNRLH